MPKSKKAIERIQFIHRKLCIGAFRPNDLLTMAKDELGLSVSRRTLINDINYLRKKGAPIPKRTKFYSYTHPYSFFEVLDSNEAELHKELINIFMKLGQLSKLDKLLNLNNDINLGQSAEKKVYFDSPLENLQNAELLPRLFSHILKEDVLNLRYVDFNDEVFKVVFHPYVLKEYNGRWYVFGLNQNTYQAGRKSIYLYPLDRIRKVEKVIKPILPYFKNDWWDAERHFSEMVGVTKVDNAKPERIIIRAYGGSVDYLHTKQLHHSQKMIEEQQNYSDFGFNLIDNYEFRSKLLSMGHSVEVIEPKTLRKKFADITMKMHERYLK